MASQAVRRAISHEVRRALSAARLTAAAAARKMPADKRGKPTVPKTIYRWLNAEATAPLDRLNDFAVAVGQPLELRLGPDIDEEAAPEWERLEVMLEAVRLKLNVTDAELAQAEADLLTARRLGGSGRRRRRGTGGVPGGSGAGAGP